MQVRPIRDRGYAHPELLADTDWLADHIADLNLRVIDARPPNHFATDHLPGSVNLSGFGGIPRADNEDMATPDEFASVAGNLGISNDMTVVVYDAPSQMMGMVAWAFLYYGHRDVRLLDGGLARSTSTGQNCSTKIRTRSRQRWSCTLSSNRVASHLNLRSIRIDTAVRGRRSR